MNFRRPTGFVVGFALALPALLPVLSLVAWSCAAGSFAKGIPSLEGWMLLARTAVLALGTALLACGLGIPAALRLLAIRRWRFPVLLATLLIPPTIHGLGWASVAAQFGALMRTVGGPDLVFQGTFAALWVNGIAFAPLAIGLSAAAFLQVDPALLEAARLFQPAPRAIRRILLGIAAPYLTIGFLLIFILSLQDFTVPALFSVPAYAMGIFARFAAERDPAALAAQALPLILAALPLFFLVSRAWKRLSGNQIGGPVQPLGGLGLGSPVTKLFADLWICLPALAPLLLLGLSFDITRWRTAVERALPDLGYSLELAALASVVAVVLGALLARQMDRMKRALPLLATLCLIPLVLPSVLPSIGVLKLMQILPPEWEDAGPFLAALCRVLPIAAFILLTARRRRDPGLLDAARLLGRSPRQRFLRIHVPMLVPAAAAAMVAAFTFTMGECAGMILVLPPGRSTLATRLFNLLHYGAGPDVAALSTLLSVLSGAAAALAVWAAKRGTRWRMRS
jgi:iron(III) transport system permease protein